MAVWSRSREGAWIEILRIVRRYSLVMVAPVRERGLKSFACKLYISTSDVAPVRERGLKCKLSALTSGYNRRSREGAWIEILKDLGDILTMAGRSREGAWIEIKRSCYYENVLYLSLP